MASDALGRTTGPDAEKWEEGTVLRDELAGAPAVGDLKEGDPVDPGGPESSDLVTQEVERLAVPVEAREQVAARRVPDLVRHLTVTLPNGYDPYQRSQQVGRVGLNVPVSRRPYGTGAISGGSSTVAIHCPSLGYARASSSAASGVSQKLTERHAPSTSGVIGGCSRLPCLAGEENAVSSGCSDFTTRYR
jgi:hypothetical protein